MTSEGTQVRDLESRLAAVEADNAELRARLNETRMAVEAARRDPEVSRRALLRRVGGAAALGLGVFAAGSAMGTERADAATGSFSTNDAVELAVDATNTGGGTAVRGVNSASGLPNDDWYRVGLPGVLGTTVGDDPGVGGSSSAGPGVWGHAAPGPGVKGTSNNGTAVYGVTGSPSGFTQIAGVVGDSNVRAIPGVAGLSSNGVGLLGRGAAAPLRLVPSSSTGPPTGTGFDGGEIALDAAGSLFVCLDALHWNRVAYGSGFFAMNPTRVCDTRPNTGPGGSVANNPLNVYAGDTMSPFGDLTVFVAGPIGPGAQQTVVPATATAVVLNLAVVNFSAPGNFTVYPADLANPPTAANLNWPGPQADGLAALSNSVTVRIGNPSGDSARRAVRIHNASSGATDVVVDLAGYYL